MTEERREYPSDPLRLAEMRGFVAEVCRRAWGEEGDEALGELQLAVQEAATNIIRHAYAGERGRPIHLVVEAGPDWVSVALLHEGRDFDPESAPAPVFDGSREGGFGLYLIRRLADEVHFTRDAVGGRGVRLVKYRGSVRKGVGSMQLTVDTVQGVAVVTLNLEEFDASNSDDFKQEIAPVLQASARLVLDLHRVRFVDSSGCGAILSCLKHATAAGGDLKLCRVQPLARTTFELIRLHRICEIFDTREEAVAAFQPKPPAK